MATLNIRLPDSEAETLARHCKKVGRTKTDLLREFIRSLEELEDDEKADNSR